MADNNRQGTRLEEWRVLESRMALNERWCKIRCDRVRLPDGKILDEYFLALRPNVAVVFALSENHTLPLVRQYKHGAGEITVELPAGTFIDEAPEVAGRRELIEETGWDAEELTCVGEFFDDASKNTNKVYCLVGQGACRKEEQRLDETETSSGIEIVEVGVDELEELLADGGVKAQSSVASAYRALAWLRGKGLL